MATARQLRTPGPAFLRFLGVARRDGLRAAWIKALHELKVYRRLYLLDIPNDDATSPAGCDLPLEVGLLQADEFDEYVAFRPDQQPSEIRGRLAEEHWCFVGRHLGRIVTAAWSCTDSAPIEYLECRVRLPQGVVFSYDVYTHPDYRGHRVSTVVYDWRRHWLREAGYPRSIGILWPENVPAARRLAHRPYTVFGTLGTWKIGGWKRHVLHLTPEAVDSGVPLVTLHEG